MTIMMNIKMEYRLATVLDSIFVLAKQYAKFSV
jgi:hypothetical protein